MRDINKYAEVYAQRDFEFYQVKYRRKMVLEQIEKYKPLQILEIGCGMEPLFLYTQDVAFTIVEPSEKFCENAQASARGGNVKIYNDFFENVNLDEQYDMIVCSSLLHELEHPEVLVEKIAECCTHETIVHFNVPNAKSMHRLLAMESGYIDTIDSMSERNVLLQQHMVFTKEKLEEMLTKLGMEILESGTYFVKPFTHVQMLRLLEAGIVEEKVLDGFYNIAKYIPELGSEIYVNCRVK